MFFINFFMSFFSCQATQKATLKSNMPFWFCVCRFFVIIQYSFSEYTPSSFPCFDTSTYNGHLENYGEKPCFVSHPVFSNFSTTFVLQTSLRCRTHLSASCSLPALRYNFSEADSILNENAYSISLSVLVTNLPVSSINPSGSFD